MPPETQLSTGMTLLPLFTLPADPDAWHQVTAPGGYEGWYFDAQDSSGDVQIVAAFLHGSVFHPEYLRRYAAYVRHPTRRLPPTAADYPCVYFAIYERGKAASQFMTQFAPSDFHAATDRTDVAMASNTMTRTAAGALLLSLAGNVLSAELTFLPRITGRAMERTLLSRQLSGGYHRWVIADPLCDVSGTIRLARRPTARRFGASVAGSSDAIDGATARTIHFSGHGYHDHKYGTAPVRGGLKRWVWGRAIAGNRMYAFHFARAVDRALPDEVHLVRASVADGVAEIPVTSTEIDWSGRTAMGLSYPRQITFPPFLRLTSPRIMNSTPLYVRLMYEARLDDAAVTTAFCDVAYPHRLRWPMLGRLIGMAHHRAT